jgi:hypothetical protein
MEHHSVGFPINQAMVTYVAHGWWRRVLKVNNAPPVIKQGNGWQWEAMANPL